MDHATLPLRDGDFNSGRIARDLSAGERRGRGYRIAHGGFEIRGRFFGMAGGAGRSAIAGSGE